MLQRPGMCLFIKELSCNDLCELFVKPFCPGIFKDHGLWPTNLEKHYGLEDRLEGGVSKNGE